MTDWFKYDEEDVDWLKKAHPRMRFLIETVGPIKRQVWPDPFFGMIRIILGQQISSKVQDTLWDRFIKTFGNLSPAQITRLDPEEIKSVGTSLRKAACIQNVAKNFANGTFKPQEWKGMGPNELGYHLTQVPGIGPWTVEMLLIFTLGNPDVISWHDAGIRSAIKTLYDRKTLSWTQFMDFARKYTPVSSLASMYLWELAGKKYTHIIDQLKNIPLKAK